jgi:hypothetical protein
LAKGSARSFVAEDAVEGGAADAELAGGAELVAAVEVENILDVMLDDGIEVEAVGARAGRSSCGVSRPEGRARSSGRMTPLTASSRAVSRTAASSRTLPGQLCWSRRASVPGPKRRGAADSGRRCGRAATGPARRCLRGAGAAGNGKADGGEAEGEVGQQQALTGHLAQRGLRGGQHHGAARRAVLEGLEHAQQQSLARRGEQVDAIQIGEAGEGGRIGVGDQPLAGVAALKAAAGQRERLKR